MKRFLTTAATAMVLATGAYADNHMASFDEVTFDAANDLYASELIGMRVYAHESTDSGEGVDPDNGDNLEDIGEINDIILNKDGTVRSVIVGVGGFLGIDEKDVAVNMSDLKFVADEDDSGDYQIMIAANADSLESAPAYMTEDEADMTEEKAMTDDTAAMTQTDADVERDPLTPPAVEREGYSDMEVDDLNTEDLTGARVYGPNDEDVGEVSELLLTDDGKLDRAIIDVGGFLGMGEHTVAVSMDELQIVREDDGDDVRVYIDSSEEALESLPEYED